MMKEVLIMPKCKDCIHYDACCDMSVEPIDKILAYCHNFQNKADFVDVVRCKNCRNRIERNWAKCAGRKPDDFCSDGEQK